MTAYLVSSPPEGNGINLSWYLGNSLIFNLYPQKKVFVDPRTETYPKEFIQRVFAAEESQEELLSLIKQYNARWFLGELSKC